MQIPGTASSRAYLSIEACDRKTLDARECIELRGFEIGFRDGHGSHVLSFSDIGFEEPDSSRGRR